MADAHTMSREHCCTAQQQPKSGTPQQQLHTIPDAVPSHTQKGKSQH